MTDYTPTTEDMRGCYVNHCQITHGLTETVAWDEFDRFLAQHDAEVKAEAWDEGRAAGFSNAMRRMSDEPNAPASPNPYRPTPEES